MIDVGLRCVRIMIVAVCSLLLFFAALLWTWFSPHTKWNANSIIVQPGGSYSQLVTSIAKSNDTLPYWLVDCSLHLMGDKHQVHYGQYRLQSGLSVSALMSNIYHKQGMVRHKITFIEGWTFRQIKQALLKNPNVRHSKKALADKQVMRLIGDPKQHPEGQFFPDTYQFVWGNSSLDILRQSHQKMTQVLQDEWQQKAKGLRYKTPYEALIVASLIEVEASDKSERPLVAGVILQRLKLGMRLQIDPTVSYGLNKPYGRPLTKFDLSKVTPYNTYRVGGLPPTPIDMPSRSSIHAALHPKFKGYLYYVSRGDGTHRFSATYDEHREAVADYRSTQRKKQQHSGQVMLHWPVQLSTNWWVRPAWYIFVG